MDHPRGSRTSRRRQRDVALLVALCLLVSLLSLDLFPDVPPPPSASSRGWRRHLKAEARDRQRRRARGPTTDDGPLPPWAEQHLQPLTVAPDPARETALFWHINKSGGTTAKALFECLGRTMTSRAGALPRFGHDQDEDLVAFQPWKKRNNLATYVNVDTSGPLGILRAAEMGLIASGLADVVIVSDPAFAVAHLFDPAHRGRALALFRHPVERLVSKFYYLQTATWERTYRPEWKNVTVLQFAKKRNRDNNFMVKKLAGKKNNVEVGEEDVLLAMRTVQRRFVVGLTNRMEESARRFNVVLGVDEAAPERRRCMDDFFGHGKQKKKNANPHTQVKEGSPAWKAFAKKNALDIRLFEYVLELFEEQKGIIASYAEAMTVQAPRTPSVEDS